MSYPDAAWERAMTIEEVILKALSGERHWFRAAEVLGWSPRTLGGGGSATSRTATRPVDCGSGAPPFGGRRRPEVSGSCGCIASGITASMSATSMRSFGASTAARSRIAM